MVVVVAPAMTAVMRGSGSGREWQGGSSRVAGSGVSNNSSGRHGVGEEEAVCREIGFCRSLLYV